MNTERVKNILIVLFSAIALGLALLVFLDEGRYSLVGAQETAIINLLEQNDVFLSERMEMPRSFRPMRPLDLQRYDFDREGIVARFFDTTPQVEIDGGNMIFFTDDREMVYSYHHNWIIFDIPSGITNEAFSAAPGGAAAQQLAVEYIEALLGMPPNMEHFFTRLNHNNDYVIGFFSTYRGHVLYNDHIRVTVTSAGITYILYSRVENNGLVGEARPIFSADEALLALLNHVRNMQIEGRILLEAMRMDYYLVEENGVAIGVPTYVFTAQHVPTELVYNFIFNAYTNKYIWHEIIR